MVSSWKKNGKKKPSFNFSISKEKSILRNYLFLNLLSHNKKFYIKK